MKTIILALLTLTLFIGLYQIDRHIQQANELSSVIYLQSQCQKTPKMSLEVLDEPMTCEDIDFQAK